MQSANHSRMARLRAAGLALTTALVLAACGGGGGGGSGSGGGGSQPVVPAESNVVSLVVDSGPAGLTGRVANLPYVSVTVCPPGSTSNCQVIDHVLVDTGSSGLRLMASALGTTTTNALPQLTNTASTPYATCGVFLSGYTWGSVRSADITLGGLTTAALPIQVISDPRYPTAPTGCSNGTGGPRSEQKDVATLGAKGILGISQFRQDCGANCVTFPQSNWYYTCTSATACTASTIPLAKQVANPVAAMPTDNNGSVIVLPAVAPSGQVSATGQLVMGIGTRGNNAVGRAVAYGLDTTYGYLSTTYNGRTYAMTAFDSGSNFNFFADASLPICSNISTGRFYCPATTQSLQAVVTGTAGNSGLVNFRIANASAMFSVNGSFAVIPDVGAQLGSTSSAMFIWGMPFFYGRSVFTAFEGAATPLGTGPFVAF